MPFPKISPQVSRSVFVEFECEENHEKRMEHVGEVLKRIAVENPTIATFLTALPTVPSYNDRTTLSHAIGFAINVYRLVEEELKLQGLPMPVVAPEIGAPLQAEFWRDPNGLRERLHQENPRLVTAGIDWFMESVVDQDWDSYNRISVVGYLTYAYIRGQWDANELKDQIGSKLS